MIRRLDEDGNLAPATMITGTIEYRELEVCPRHAGILGAIGNLFLSRVEGSVWEDHVEVLTVSSGEFLYGSTSFHLINESVTGRHGPTMSIQALTDGQSQIPVFQRLEHTQGYGLSFVRCEPRARIVTHADEIAIECLGCPPLALYRKAKAPRADNRRVSGNLYVQAELLEQTQTELIATLTILALASSDGVLSRPLL